MYVKGRTWHLLALGAVLACGGEDLVDADGDGVADGVKDPNNVTVVTPTRPLGFVAGDLRDALNDEPLSGVKVELSMGGLPEGIDPVFTTDASGTFRYGPLPAGAAFTLRFTAEGYAPVRLSDLVIDDTAGDFPTLNGALYVGPLRLLRAEASFTVRVASAEGALVPGAEVTVETAASYLWADAARGGAHGRATTDAEGKAVVERLPNVWALPPSLEAAGAVTIHVAPVDLDGDGALDLAGVTRVMSGREVREQGATAWVVLPQPVAAPLAVLATNVPGLAVPGAAPSMLESAAPVRVVLNKPVDRDAVLVDLRDEQGEPVTSTLLVSGLENVLEISAAGGLMPGREYNLGLRIQALDATPVEVLQLASPFFVRDERDRAITVTGRFLDDGDEQWGTGNDRVEIELSIPVGRPLSNPAFQLEVFFDLDLNGTSTVGDGAGELPRTGEYPSPILLNAAEPTPLNGAGLSGFTRFVSPRGINLPVPLGRNNGAVTFEVRFRPERNGGRAVTTPSGRAAPERLTGSAPLTSGG
jgi:hypothetical protein